MSTLKSAPLRKSQSSTPGFIAWQAHRAFEMHVNSSYDLIKYGCKAKAISPANYMKISERKRWVYTTIENNHDQSLAEIIRSMMFYSTGYTGKIIDSPHEKLFIPIGDLVHQHFVDALSKHCTKMYHRRESFMNDLNQIVPLIVKDDTDGAARKALIQLLCGNVETATMNIYKAIIRRGMCGCGFDFETIIVLDKIGKCSEKAIAHGWWKDTPYADLARRINKLGKMFDPDIKKYESFILDFCNTHTEKKS